MNTYEVDVIRILIAMILTPCPANLCRSSSSEHQPVSGHTQTISVDERAQRSATAQWVFHFFKQKQTLFWSCRHHVDFYSHLGYYPLTTVSFDHDIHDHGS